MRDRERVAGSGERRAGGFEVRCPPRLLVFVPSAVRGVWECGMFVKEWWWRACGGVRVVACVWWLACGSWSGTGQVGSGAGQVGGCGRGRLQPGRTTAFASIAFASTFFASIAFTSIEFAAHVGVWFQNGEPCSVLVQCSFCCLRESV